MGRLPPLTHEVGGLSLLSADAKLRSLPSGFSTSLNDSWLQGRVFSKRLNASEVVQHNFTAFLWSQQVTGQAQIHRERK